MGDKSEIEWTDATWNPTRGCPLVSAGCANYYAMRGEVRLVPEVFAQPLRWKRPRRIFVNSMSDLFHKDMPVSHFLLVFDIMRRAYWHQFQVLTKLSDNLRELDRIIDWPRNVWMGVSVESEEHTWRIDDLCRTNARTKFLSIEPLLGPLSGLDLSGIDWVIVGGESGLHARPMHPDWVRSIRDQCQAAGVPFFFKQWGQWEPRVGSDDPDGFGYPLWPDGHLMGPRDWTPGPQMKGSALMYCVGKKAAGAVLDGREWREMPKC